MVTRCDTWGSGLQFATSQHGGGVHVWDRLVRHWAGFRLCSPIKLAHSINYGGLNCFWKRDMYCGVVSTHWLFVFYPGRWLFLTWGWVILYFILTWRWKTVAYQPVSCCTWGSANCAQLTVYLWRHARFHWLYTSPIFNFDNAVNWCTYR